MKKSMESVTPARSDSTKNLIFFNTESLPRLYCVDEREQNTVRILCHQARDTFRLGLIVKSASLNGLKAILK